jgi:hypothetical protein
MFVFGMTRHKAIQAEGLPARQQEPPPSDRRKNGLPKASRKLKRKIQNLPKTGLSLLSLNILKIVK